MKIYKIYQSTYGVLVIYTLNIAMFKLSEDLFYNVKLLKFEVQDFGTGKLDSVMHVMLSENGPGGSWKVPFR